MYVCMYVCMYVYIHIHRHIYIYIVSLRSGESPRQATAVTEQTPAEFHSSICKEWLVVDRNFLVIPTKEAAILKELSDVKARNPHF